MGRHRKLKRAFNEPFHAHFVTFSCYRRLPLLARSQSCQWVIDSLDQARETLDVAVWAYVIMPEHLHLLLFPRRSMYRMSQILAAVKRPVSAAAKQHLLETSSDKWLDRLTSRKGPNRVFRFWQPGGGFDRNLDDRRDLESVADYIHQNSVRRRLAVSAMDWEWSSARSWHKVGDDPLGVNAVES